LKKAFVPFGLQKEFAPRQWREGGMVERGLDDYQANSSHIFPFLNFNLLTHCEKLAD